MSGAAFSFSVCFFSVRLKLPSSSWVVPLEAPSVNVDQRPRAANVQHASAFGPDMDENLHANWSNGKSPSSASVE